jgi:RecB family exonuclease
VSSFELKLDLPDSLAREAEASGLLTPEAIEALLRAEIRRRRVDKLFDAADRLAALDAPLTEAEVEAEIAAVRQARCSADASRS